MQRREQAQRPIKNCNPILGETRTENDDLVVGDSEMQLEQRLRASAERAKRLDNERKMFSA